MTGATATLVAHEHSLRQRILPFVGEREQHATPTPRAPDLPRPSGEHGLRRLATLAAHLELAPVHAQPEPGAERLQRRLLRREARREVRHGVAPPAAVGNLLRGEDALQEAVLPAVDHLAHARDAHQIDADPRDGHAAAIARAGAG